MKKSADFARKTVQTLKEHRFVIFLFLISTAFFICQHSAYISWDFSTYVLNAEYWFANGSYFEILRPPLMPLLIGIFSFAGSRAAEFIFIIIVSLLFAYSSVKLSRVLKFNPVLFYALSLGFYVLNYGLINGTELLALAFLELFIAFLAENRYISGLFLGLSALSRYSMLVFFPLIILHLNLKKILKSLALFAGIILVWLVYNFCKTGNFFTSFADQYANNVLLRWDIFQPVQISHFFKVQNFLIPFFIIGLIVVLCRIFMRIKNSEKAKKSAKSGFESFLKFADDLKIEIIMLFILIYSVQSYADIPIKNVRYLFNLVLPTVYFAYTGIDFIVDALINKLIKRFIKQFKNIKKEIILLILAAAVFAANMILLALFLSSFPPSAEDPSAPYLSAIDKMHELNLSNCSVLSNSWIKLNYFGLASSPFPRLELVNYRLDEGNIIILFSREPEPPYVHNESLMASLPTIYKNKDYSILGVEKEKCAPPKKSDLSYLQQLDSEIFYIHHKHLNYNPCIIMFHSSPFLEKTCNFVNFNGFKLDKNRTYQ